MAGDSERRGFGSKFIWNLPQKTHYYKATVSIAINKGVINMIQPLILNFK